MGHDPTVRGKGGGKPRIALVIDTDGWAFANISRQICRHLGDRYDFDILPMTWLSELGQEHWRAPGGVAAHLPPDAMGIGPLLIQSPDYDLIHVFWREYLGLIDSPLLVEYARRLGLDYETFAARYIRDACITTAVYDHLYIDPAAIAQRRRVFNTLAAGYHVASRRLDRLYRGFDGLRPPRAVIEDGVDTELFRPADLGRLETVANREIVLGWVGNSGWTAEVEDFKGVHTILKPAVEQLRAEGAPVRLEMADRQQAFIPHAAMPDYYARIDLYVCTSRIEGTPNPVLESMACGIPVISTDVGIVPEVFGHRQAEFILAERSVECLKAAIRRFIATPSLFTDLSRENLASIAGWSWRHQVRKFEAFFDGVLLERRAAGAGSSEGVFEAKGLVR
ncbi:glycosyltransferase family 4 protein [Neoroseomonas soli]|uniref:Glycosyltransferase n=1 Tax=Neoroseomonas soli TaxID=1081025 RepID=A0A9X9WZT6_9PROT|nr:glycosyltransferase [Neoroseomonas soli]MBR0672665.1 glycosyltransferase [Neoroseomonas soli]